VGIASLGHPVDDPRCAAPALTRPVAGYPSGAIISVAETKIHRNGGILYLQFISTY
jgi:hypothetical protein